MNAIYNETTGEILVSKNISLRKQFLTRILTILLIISIVSSGIQLYFMNQQINYEIDTQTAIISQSINQGIEETNLASKNIGNQIDLKMFGYLKYIGDMLNTNRAEDITNEQISTIKQQLNLAGLSIFERKGNDIVIVKSTDPKEIGFSSRKFGDMVYQGTDMILKGEKINFPGIFSDKALAILPIMQSGVHKEKPLFFKYAYYHPEGTNYIINPFIKADEVYQFTQSVGPDSWIRKMEKDNSFVKDISVLDPKVFNNPNLENQFWPPVKKVVYGAYQYQSKKDLDAIKRILKKPVKQTYVEEVKGKKVLKLFLPQKNGQIIHVVFDYDKMTKPLYLHFIILVLTGLVSLSCLFLLTFKLFSQIYENIKKVIKQIHLLESGDLTAKSSIKDNSELSVLSENVNSMTHKLHNLVKDTQKQASKTQNLSLLLEKEAAESVEKIYEISTETTMKAREQLYEIEEFLNSMDQVLLPYNYDENVKTVLKKVDLMREMANERTAATTKTTITLSDLLKSLHEQSRELSDISNDLLEQISIFKL